MKKDFDLLMEKYAAKKKEYYMSEKVKHGLAGAMAGLIGIPFINPIDTLEVQRKTKAGKFKPIKGRPIYSFRKKYWAGSTLRALKTAPAMAITFGLQPTFKKMLDKRFKSPKAK